MRLRSFLLFTAPTLLLMTALLALPLATTFWLSVHSCAPQFDLVTVQQSGPFGPRELTTQRARLDSRGHPVENCKFVGLSYYANFIGLGGSASGQAADLQQAGAPEVASGTSNRVFLAALSFTLLYIAATTPFVIFFGMTLALCINAMHRRARGFFISASLLPFVITPVVGALCIKWLFRDDGLVAQLLAIGGVHIYWMGQAWSAQLLVILYGIWQVSPFAFIVFYAGLQSVPQDTLEAATLDGASGWQKLRYVVLPHLAPLIVFVSLIHIMDAYRVFEPVLVLTKGAFSTSVQYLTYYVLLQENNPYKASAAAVLTLTGIAILLVPLLRRTWREQRGLA